MDAQPWTQLDDGLYLKRLIASNSYSIWATDLCQLFVEEVDAEELRWRATKNKIPVDLEDAQTLETMLLALGEAIQKGRLKRLSTHGHRVMDLTALIQLPGPFPSIAWTCKLELRPEDEFREHVTRPLLSQIERNEQREKDLKRHLRDKDHVIDKLLDALDKYSVDLADVFPSLASQAPTRRSVTRHAAEAHVPGLKPFEECQRVGFLDRGEHAGRSQQENVVVSDDQEREATDVLKSSQVEPEKGTELAHQTRRGIKRSLGARKKLDTFGEIQNQRPRSTTTQLVDLPGSTEIASRLRAATPTASTHSSGAEHQDSSQTAEEDVKKDVKKLDEDRLADKKREELRREVAAAKVSKPKKRKF